MFAFFYLKHQEWFLFISHPTIKSVENCIYNNNIIIVVGGDSPRCVFYQSKSFFFQFFLYMIFHRLFFHSSEIGRWLIAISNNFMVFLHPLACIAFKFQCNLFFHFVSFHFLNLICIQLLIRYEFHSFGIRHNCCKYQFFLL